MKLRILLLTYGYPPDHAGGYELRCRDIVSKLVERGHIVRIITTRVEKHGLRLEWEHGISRVFHEIRSFTPIPEMLRCSFNDVLFLDRVVKDFSPDVIYLFHVINFTRYLYPYLAKLDIPVVYDEGGYGLTYAWLHHRWFSNSKSLYKTVTKQLVRQTLQILSNGLLQAHWAWPSKISAYFNSNKALEHAENNRVPLQRRKVIYSAVDLNLFRYSERSDLSEPIRIIVPGRIEAAKGTIDAIDWFEHMQRHRVPVQLTIVGNNTDDAYYNILVNRAKQTDPENIVIMPQVPHAEIAALLRYNHVCFFPSYHNSGLSRTPLEAMASGTLVISYGGESSKNTIEHGKTGFIVEPKEWEVAEGILRMLMTEPSRYREILACARRYVETVHNFEDYINQIEQFLREARRPL